MERIEEEQQPLKKIATACFDQTLKADPERYLRTSFQQQGVNLNLMAGIYQQAKQLGIIEQPQIDDANGMFEYVRQKLQKGQGYGRASAHKWVRWEDLRDRLRFGTS